MTFGQTELNIGTAPRPVGGRLAPAAAAPVGAAVAVGSSAAGAPTPPQFALRVAFTARLGGDVPQEPGLYASDHFGIAAELLCL